MVGFREVSRRFDLVLRLDNDKVADLNLDKLFVRTAEGIQIPVSEVATIELVNGPLQINRDATKRRIVIGVNVRDADIQKVVRTIQETLDKHIKLEPGYYFEYGGQFENLRNAIDTLTIVIPVALSLILLLLFFAFKSVTYSLVVFSTVVILDRGYSGPLVTRVAFQYIGGGRLYRLVWRSGF